MARQARITPVLLKGFRDYLPRTMLAREALIDTARNVYRSYGFAPIDTPALEYSEILLGKGGAESDKQLFRFTDQGQRDVAMRFDLTVPLARFVAQHLQEVGTPFKAYHVGPVWRAEKPQRGRYREFIQCDFDTIGTRSTLADIETLLVIHDLMDQLGFARFEIRINDRAVLNGLLQREGLANVAVDVLRALDKLAKVGADAVLREMVEQVGIQDTQARRILELAELRGSPEQILAGLDKLVHATEQGEAGVTRLREVLSAVRSLGLPEERIVLDPSIARGLDYYTGTIYETFLTDLRGIGSVCSGGRYDHLAELFTSQQLPGVGASLGVDRLLAAMEELQLLDNGQTPAAVLVTVFDQRHTGDYLRAARRLRQAGIAAELYPEARPLGKQLKYADRKRFRIALIAGDEEFEQGVWQVKDLTTGEQTSVADQALVESVLKTLEQEHSGQ